jgi:hypothetical protein
MSQWPTAVRLSAGVPGAPVRNGRVVLVVGGEQLPLELCVPAGPVTVETLLPILRGLSSLFSDRAARRTGAQRGPCPCQAGRCHAGATPHGDPPALR